MSDAVLVTVQRVDGDVDVTPGEVHLLNTDPDESFRFVAHVDDWIAMMDSQFDNKHQEAIGDE